MKKPTEKDIENSILDYLAILPGAIFWKIDVTGIYDPRKGIFRKKKSKHKHKGVSDIIGFYKGHFVAIEVKTTATRTRTTDDQKEFLAAAANNGQLGMVACSVQEVANYLRDFNNEKGDNYHI